MYRQSTFVRFAIVCIFAVVCLSTLLTAQSEKLLRSFGSSDTDGKLPLSSLILDAAGNLYGTASEGGYNNSGIVFELIPKANGEWREKVLHRQAPGAGDG